MVTVSGLCRIATLLLLSVLAMTSDSTAQTRTIYWGDEVPAGWTGKSPADLLTVPERTRWTRTMSTLQLHEWIGVPRGPGPCHDANCEIDQAKLRGHSLHGTRQCDRDCRLFR